MPACCWPIIHTLCRATLPETLAAGRALVGLGVGLASVTVPVYSERLRLFALARLPWHSTATGCCAPCMISVAGPVRCPAVAECAPPARRASLVTVNVLAM